MSGLRFVPAQHLMRSSIPSQRRIEVVLILYIYIHITIGEGRLSIQTWLPYVELCGFFQRIYIHLICHTDVFLLMKRRIRRSGLRPLPQLYQLRRPMCDDIASAFQAFLIHRA